MKGLLRKKVQALLFSLFILCLMILATPFSPNSNTRAVVITPDVKTDVAYPSGIQVNDASFFYNDAFEATTTNPVNPGWGYVRGWWLLDAYAAVNSSPDEVWVDDDWAGLNPGDPADGHTFGTDAFASIRDGIDAVTGGTVHVAAGTYYETLNLKDGIQVLGAGANVTTIDGSGSIVSVVNASNVGETTKFDGFTITNGNAPEGGGVTNHNSSLRLSNCIISYNTAPGGGGIYALVSSIVVTNCTFIGNTASNNDGGGMCSRSSSPTLTNCTFIGNTASGSGGGMYGGGQLTNCAFIDNTATDGGGMYSRLAPTLTNCTFTGNTASNRGGGFYYYGSSSPNFTNCTLTGNTANLGGGIYHTSSNTVLTNCILWDNGEEIYDIIAAPVVTYCNIQGGYPGTGNIDADPLFVDAAGGDFHLQSRQGHWTDTGWVLDAQNSPCLDTGDPASPYGNEPAPNGGRVNMGAYGNTAQASKTPVVPAVTTNAATGVFGIFATLNGNLDSLGEYDTINVSFEWGTESGVYTANTTPEAMTAPGAFSAALNGLSPDTPYYYRAKAAGNTAVYGEEQFFTTSTLPLEVWVDDDWAGLNPGNAANGYTFGYNAFATIQEGINGVSGTANVAAGTYYENITLKDGVELLGAGATVTIIDGGNNGSVVTAISVGQTTVLNGFTITNGSAHDGGGMYIYNSSPALTGCTFTGNTASNNGGGMYIYNSSPALTGCTFTGNTAHEGGGIYNTASSPELTNCTFTSNTAGYGGGMYNWQSSPALTGCTFTGNTAHDGGGMHNSLSSPELTNCTFTGNTAAINGGGMYNASSSPELTNCTFTSNTAANDGGGMYNNSSPTLSGCTFTGNTAINGGGMYNNASSPTLSNCIFTGNSAHNGGGMYNTSSSPVLTRCIFTGNTTIDGSGMYNTNSSSPALTGCIFNVNTATGNGGGVYNTASSLTISNCTFYGNMATNGGGLYNIDFSSLELTNCILWDNGEEIYALISTPVVTYCAVQGVYSGTGNIDTDPLFVDTAGGDFHLQSRQGHWTDTGWVLDARNSPCIDTGNPTSPYSNEPAPNGGRVNMGAYGNTDQASKSPDTAEVTTNAATNVTDMTATLNGNLDSLGDYDTINVSFEWGTVSGVYTANNTPEAMTTPGAFTAALSGLNSTTTYYYRAKATGNTAVYGEERTFTTLNSTPTAPVVDVTPNLPITDDNLICTVITESIDIDGDTVTYTYEWYKDGELQSDETTTTTGLIDTLSSTLTSVGETWKCVVTPNDGIINGTSAEDQVIVVAASKTENVTGDTLDATTEADTAVSVNGTATVTVAEYADNPGSGFSGDIDKHIDVCVNDATGVNELEIRLYYTDSDITGKVESSLRMYWCDNSVWAVCSDTGVNTTDTNNYSGYIWVKIRNDTNPTLDDLSGTPFGAGANQQQPGRSNGGGGGGGSYANSLSEYTTSTGKFFIDATASSADNLVRIEIPRDTIGKDRNGNRLRFITIKKQTAPADPPTNYAFVCQVYDIGPTGTTLEPFGYLVFYYNDDDIPEGVAEENLVLVTWQDGAWVELDGCIVDPNENTIKAQVSHFSVFTAIARIARADFEVTGMTVIPEEVEPGESVTINVTVTNTGDLTDNYTIVMQISGAAVDTKEITLIGGESRTVSFTVARDTGGEYVVNVGSLSDSFAVKESEPAGNIPEVPPPEPAKSSPATKPTPKPAATLPGPTQPAAESKTTEITLGEPAEYQGVTWWLIVIYVFAGVIVVGLVVYFFARRRSTAA